MAPGILQELQTDMNLAVSQLAEFAGKYANDRELVYKAVLLKRAIGRTEETPTPEQINEGVKLLKALIEDQAAAAQSGNSTRNALAEAARSRALSIPVPKAIVFECSGLGKGYRRGAFVLKNISVEARYGEIIGIVGRSGNGMAAVF